MLGQCNYVSLGAWVKTRGTGIETEPDFGLLNPLKWISGRRETEFTTCLSQSSASGGSVATRLFPLVTPSYGFRSALKLVDVAVGQFALRRIPGALISWVCLIAR